MRLYKTRDLQKNTKEVLDEASKDTVIIQRGTEFYRLMSVDIFDREWDSPEKIGVPQKNEAPKPRVDDLFPEKNNSEPSGSGALPTRDELIEQPCCANDLTPCKHWVWDAQTGEGYKNVLSGRLMEVEG